MCGERIRVIDKGNMHAFCPSCNSIETWEHVVLCEKIKNKLDDWVNKLNNKVIDVVKKVKASTHERKVANEIITDVRKYFNRERVISGPVSRCWA